MPEAEFRQQRISTPGGGVGKQRDFPGGALFMPLLTGTRKYTDIPVPALIIFANPHGLGAWVDGSTDPTGADGCQILRVGAGGFNGEAREGS
jgi:hypothetical protein